MNDAHNSSRIIMYRTDTVTVNRQYSPQPAKVNRHSPATATAQPTAGHRPQPRHSRIKPRLKHVLYILVTIESARLDLVLDLDRPSLV